MTSALEIGSGSLPSYKIRPGVTFPNWSVVRSGTARDALLAIFEVFNLDRCWTGYSEEEDRVRVAILERYRHAGRPPTTSELVMSCGITEQEVVTALRTLRDRDLVVLDEEQAQIVGAYPFTERATGHEVRLDSVTVNAMCAVDALGAGAMYGLDTVVDSSCRACGAPVRITTSGEGAEIRGVSPPEALVWNGIQYEGQAATSLCTVIAFFCSDTHLDKWRAGNREERGFRLTLDEALQVGKAIFTPFLKKPVMG